MSEGETNIRIAQIAILVNAKDVMTNEDIEFFRQYKAILREYKRELLRLNTFENAELIRKQAKVLRMIKDSLALVAIGKIYWQNRG